MTAQLRCLIIVSVGLGCGAINQPEPERGASPHPISETFWDAHYLSGSKVGYTSTQVVRHAGPDGTPWVTTTSSMLMRVTRFGAVTTQRLEIESVDTQDGQLVRFATRMQNGNGLIETLGERGAGQLKLTVSSGQSSETTTIPWNTAWGGIFAVDQALRNRPLQPQETRTLRSFMPVLNQIADITLRSVGYEETALLSSSRRLLKVEAQFTLQGGQPMETISWVDSDGRILKSLMPALRQESYRTTEKLAKDMSGAATFDIGADMTVRVSRPLDDPHATTRVVYRIRLATRPPEAVFATSLTQVLEPVGDNQAVIVVQRINPDEDLTGPPLRPPHSHYRQPSAVIQSDDPHVVALAERLAGQESDPWIAAQNLERAVHEYIELKDFTQAFSTAAEVVRTRQGDCTEHAVLLAALCRARGIPAGVVVGLVYHPPLQGFAYHMWNEVWIGDRWIPLDATLGLGGIGAAHLKIADADLHGAGALSAFLPVSHVMGQLELEIEAVEYGENSATDRAALDSESAMPARSTRD